MSEAESAWGRWADEYEDQALSLDQAFLNGQFRH
jgi:hypothetical protein